MAKFTAILIVVMGQLGGAIDADDVDDAFSRDAEVYHWCMTHGRWSVEGGLARGKQRLTANYAKRGRWEMAGTKDGDDFDAQSLLCERAVTG